MMTAYRMEEIDTDGYDRCAVIKRTVGDDVFCVGFWEYGEYLENGRLSAKRKPGDTVTGELSIELVCHSQRVHRTLTHAQSIPHSPHIEAVVAVSQIVDKDAVYAWSSLQEDEIWIEFESAVDYRVGDRILIKGELRFHENEREAVLSHSS